MFPIDARAGLALEDQLFIIVSFLVISMYFFTNPSFSALPQASHTATLRAICEINFAGNQPRPFWRFHRRSSLQLNQLTIEPFELCKRRCHPSRKPGRMLWPRGHTKIQITARIETSTQQPFGQSAHDHPSGPARHRQPTWIECMCWSQQARLLVLGNIYLLPQ